MASDDQRDDDRGESPDEELNGSGSDFGGTLLSALKSKELLVPAALSAAGALAASKGPDLMRRLTEATEEKGEEEAQKLGANAVEGVKKSAGGGGGLMGSAVSKALGKGGSSGGKKTRRLPIQRWTDVAVPVSTAYDAFTEFDDFPKFMHRVLNVEQKGDDKVSWQEKIWFSKRQWEGRVVDRRKNDRIAWKTTGGMSHKGVVSFHPVSERLTRVMVTMEFEPNGMVEKMASGLRFVKRAVEADLARFKAYVELEDAKGIEYRPVKEDDEQDDRDGKSDDERESGRRDRESGRRERREGADAR
jgi:uncharacterized membrane protein